ncbi:MAG: FKBP-type peptidyl-prolyl cis-trans isomerase [Lacipirellulaceae bacterium]
MKRLFAFSFAIGFVAAAAYAQDNLPTPDAPAAAAPGPAAGAEGPADADGQYRLQVSYCLGLDLGRGLAADGIEVDFDALAAGIRDALSGAEPKLTEEQFAACMGRFQQEMQRKAQEAQKQMVGKGEANLARGEKFLAENATKEGVLVTPSGLQYRVIQEGAGAAPGPRDTVRCHYEGTLIDGKVFDSSYKRGEPAEFPVNRVIAGWTEALQMMKPGAKWEVFLPTKIAYGERGAPGAIGPNEALVFTIELIAVVD